MENADRRRYLEREIEQDLAHVTWAPRVNISARTGRHLDKLVPALETRRRAGRGLRAEEDAGLLAAAQRVRVLGDEFREERVELAGGDPLIPRLQRRLERRHERVNISARTGRHLDKLVPALETALESWDQRISTGKFNAFLAELADPTTPAPSRAPARACRGDARCAPRC
jgi:predicted GTPase